jgi:glycerophosphoryl diester phosphodiesterase
MKKNQLEDIFIIIVVLAAIYGVYNFFTSGDDKIVTQAVTQTSQNINEKQFEIPTENKKEITNEIVNDTTNEKKLEKVVEVNKVVEKQKIEKKVVEKPKEQKIKELKVDDSITVSSFYETIRKDIQKKIDKKVKTNNYFNSKDGYVNIRLTILKNGSYEQLRFQDGDLAFYDFIKSDIKSHFPITMYQNIEDKFPRYFRMKVVY